MSKHKVIRTSSYHSMSDDRSNIKALIDHLDKGWIILSATTTLESRVEYVLQLTDSKQEEDEDDPRVIDLLK